MIDLIGDLRFRYSYPTVEIYDVSTGILVAEIVGICGNEYDSYIPVDWAYLYEYNLLRVYI